jgi:uncharacterized membrane protein YdjX (TVP38/TMEM64 family)
MLSSDTRLALLALTLSVAAAAGGLLALSSSSTPSSVSSETEDRGNATTATDLRALVGSLASRYSVDGLPSTSARFLSVAGVYFGVYVVKTTFLVPGSPLFNAGGGTLFGFARGLVLVALANAVGSFCCFALARSFGARFLPASFSSASSLVPTGGGDRKSGRVLALFQTVRSRAAGLDQRGLVVFCTLIRLVPGAPHTLLNAVLALCAVPLVPFLVGTVVGMLPFIALTVQAGDAAKNIARGDSLPSSFVWVMGGVAAAAVLGLAYDRHTRTKAGSAATVARKKAAESDPDDGEDVLNRRKRASSSSTRSRSPASRRW